jgi:hypothetical protein
MTPVGIIPDDIIEAIVAERSVRPPYACLVGLADDVRAVGDGPAPDPSAELAALLRGSRAGSAAFAEDMPTGVAVRRRPSLATKVAGLGVLAKVGLGTSIAAAGVIGGGAAGVLPGGAADVVRSAVEAISPFELGGSPPEQPVSKPDAGSSRDSGTGSDGSDGATDAEDGSGGSRGPRANGVDEPPGQTSDTGLTRANETPAEPHAPDTTPATPTTAAHPTPSSTVPPRPDDPGGGTPPPAVPGASAGTRDD